MNWGAKSGPPASARGGPPQGGRGGGGGPKYEDDDDGGAPPSGAMPPTCPRCEINKAQFTRTIQNYQKAYRKKVQGLKAELTATRATVVKLNKRVKSLKGFKRIHVPSMVVGVVVGLLVKKLYGRLFGGGGGKKADGKKAVPSGKEEEEETVVEVVETSSVVKETVKQQPEDAGEQIAVEVIS